MEILEHLTPEPPGELLSSGPWLFHLENESNSITGFFEDYDNTYKYLIKTWHRVLAEFHSTLAFVNEIDHLP